MSTHAEFSRRLEALFITELRRQGVSDTETWAEKLHTYCSYVPTSSATDDARGHHDDQKAMPSTVLVIDMTNLKLGDKPVVALCESLLKMDGAPLRREPDSVRELQVIWRRCGLTDRVLRHLELLLLGCQRLALLDVSANSLSSEAMSSLLHAAAEVSCDVILTEDVRAMHSGGRIREASAPSSFRGTPLSLELDQPGCNQQRRRGAVKASKGASIASVGLNQLHLRGDQHRKQTSHGMEWQASSLATHATAARPPRQRSPSLDGASVSASLRSYASGSAEALQKRREELFGRPSTAPLALDPPSSPAAAVSSSASSVPPAAEDGVIQGATAGVARGPMAITGGNSVVAPKSSPRSPAQTSSAEKATSGGGGGHLCFAAASGRSSSPRAVNPTGTETPVSTHPTGDARGGPTPGTARVASREPFEDPNDQIDVTDNLSPVLDSVLDLSALMTRDGALRQAHMFGGACNVWDVLAAYESAAEQQMRESASTDGRGSVDAATRAKLPAALLGRSTYNAITVLNLSRNHLTALCALPATLLRLDISVNRLTDLKGLQECSMLTVLNARRNCLQAIRGLEKNLSVAHLFLGHNNITAVDGIAHLVLLETLDLTFNKLRSQAALRMLSLCAALRHLLLRGNPIMTSKPGFMAVLRNLCPTLLVIDGHRLGNSSLANRALAKRNWDRQPHMIDSTKPFARVGMSRGDSNAAAPSPLISPAGMAGGHASADGSAMSSFAFTSRRRDGHRPVPFADGDTTASDERSMNLLHMLTRGVTTPSGYGDSLRSQHAAQQLAQSRKGEEAQTQAERTQRPTTNGRPLRGAVVKHLADQSRKYLEDTIVRRMTTVQQQLLSRNHSAQHCAGGGSDSDTAGATASDSNTRRGAVERNSYGGVAHPELVENPLADVMGYTTISPEKQQCAAIEEEGPEKEAEAELLRQYTPRVPRPRRALSAKPPPPTVAQASSRPAPEYQEAPRPRAVSTGRAPSSTASGAAARRGPAEVTRGLPARRKHRGSSEAAPATHYAGQSEQPRSQGAVRGDSRSYAALHIAEHQSWLLPEEAEIECSPITKDPRGRSATSLNTTATLLDDVNYLHRPKAAPHSEHPRATPTTTQKVRSPGAHAHRYPISPNYKDPTEVEMTAVYQGSRSPSRSSRGGGRGTEQTWQWERHQCTPSRTNAHDPKSPSQSRSTSVTAAASRVAHGGSVGGNASCSASSPSPSSSSRVKSPSMRPLHIDDAQRLRVVTWTQQLHDDTKALQEALQALVDLLVAQRQRSMPIPESSRELPPTYLQERRRCVQIIQDSGMLQDTYVPMDVVVYYGFSKAELEGETDRSMQVVAHRQGNTEANTRSWAREVAERSDVLRQVHLMGDAKTCLRYVALLVGDGREKLLQQYVDQLKESLGGEF